MHHCESVGLVALLSIAVSVSQLVPISPIDFCCSSAQGQMRYSQQQNRVDYCNGRVWLPLILLFGNSAENPASSCKHIASTYGSLTTNGVYWIKPSSNDNAYQVYCDVSEGWTLLMKLDGKKNTFNYNSDYWSNRLPFKKTRLALDDNEAKLASFWTLPFTELRLGMKMDGGVTRWIVVSFNASSLYDIIADGNHRETRIGKGKWRTLLPDGVSSLQESCNLEGFNAAVKRRRFARARLGVIANELSSNDCLTPDSMLGFGAAYESRSSVATTGNFATTHDPDNGAVNIKVIGYIMAR